MLPETSSFASLAVIDLPDARVLHPAACNPTMDLVVLLSVPGSGTDSKGKGKQREGSTGVELWRMSGSKVWETEAKGQVGGMAWSLDGLHLSLLVLGLSKDQASIDHISVHDGRLVRSCPVPQVMESAGESEWEEWEKGRRWWSMDWVGGQTGWPARKPGGPLMIFDSLPRATIPEMPKPAHMMLHPALKKQAEASGPAPRHESLKNFPSLLPSNPPVPPDQLWVASPVAQGRYAYLTGTIASGSLDDNTLIHAQVIDKISDMLDIVLKGIDVAQHHFREAGKQTTIWREEVETCGEQQGMSKKDTHADLFRLLMTGRSAPGVSEWLGNRLTGRTITKWEETMTTGYKALQRVISESITPALERIILLLQHQQANRLVPICVGLGKLIERIRQDAAHEGLAAAEFIKWLNYEIARSVVQDQSTDTPASSTHDLKLVWAFLKSGFIDSPLQLNFPQLLDKHPQDRLPPEALHTPSTSSQSLDAVLRDTFHRLNGAQSTPTHAASPLHPDPSIDSSVILSPPGEFSRLSSPEVDSPDTVAVDRHATSDEPKRMLELEPWVWANTLVGACLELVKGSLQGNHDSEFVSFDRGGDTLYIQRPEQRVEGDEELEIPLENEAILAVYRPDEKNILCVASYDGDESMHARAFKLDEGEIVALQYFDDDEVALQLAVNGQTYLATVDIGSLLQETEETVLDPTGYWGTGPDLLPLPIARCRQMEGVTPANCRSSLATNGRKGRRVGCVLTTGGKRLEVLDMDQDEEEEEDDQMEGVDGVDE